MLALPWTIPLSFNVIVTKMAPDGHGHTDVEFSFGGSNPLPLRLDGDVSVLGAETMRQAVIDGACEQVRRHLEIDDDD